MKTALKPFLILALGGLTLSIISLGIWISVNRDDFDGLMFGHVVSIQLSAIAIADREENITTVLIGTGTRITDRQQKVALEDIPIGQFVQVLGIRVNRETVEAEEIRFMRSPGRERPNDVPQ